MGKRTADGRSVEGLAARQAELKATGLEAFGVYGRAARVPWGTGLAENELGCRVLVGLCVLAAVDGAQLYAYLTLAPDIARTLGISLAALSLLASLDLLMMAVGALAAAAFLWRRPVGRGRLVALVGATQGLLSLVTGLAAALPVLLIARVGISLTGGSAQSVHRPLLADSYPPGLRVRAFCVYTAALAVALAAAGGGVAVLVGAAHLTWRAVFVVFGVCSLGAAVPCLWLPDAGRGASDEEPLRRLVRARGGPDDGADGGTGSSQGTLSVAFFESLRRATARPSLKPALLLFFSFGLFVLPLQTYVSYLCETRWVMDAGARSVTLGLLALFAVPALVRAGARGEGWFRADPGRLFGLGARALVVTATAVAVTAFVRPFWLGFLVLGVAYAGMFVAVALGSAVLMSVVSPGLRGQASALAVVAVAAGSLVGTILLSAIDARFGLGPALVIFAVVLTLLAFAVRKGRLTAHPDMAAVVEAVIEREEFGLMIAGGAHFPLLVCRRLDFSYGQLQILFDVDFSIDAGEMVALLGTNGAGKSTLLRVISGLGLPSRGSVHFQGSDITYVDPQRRVGLGIAQIAGGRAVFGPLSVADNLRACAYSLGRDSSEVRRAIDSALQAFPRLGERSGQIASTLSGGEQQMLALAKAFIVRPPLLLIDELSLGLAPMVVAELLEMVRLINARGTAVLLVEQSANVALSLVEHAYFMEKGEIRFDGRAADLVGRPDLLRSVFLEGASKGLAAMRISGS
ncbi:MAG: MFS transporter [Acidimicrobiales bacterium]